jgi:hypothetical protein
MGEVDAPAIEEFTVGRDGDKHGRVPVLRDTNDRCRLQARFRHALLLDTEA